MIKKSVIFAMIGLSAMADNSLMCRQYYDLGLEGSVVSIGKEKETKEVKAKDRISAKRKELNEKLYFPMFEDAFRTEFTESSLDPKFKELLRRLLFEPKSLTAKEYIVLRNGVNQNVKSTDANPNGSGIKYYLNFNHLTNDKQENAAENLLTKLRSPTERIELSQLEKVALRVSRVIGRDYDLFEGTHLHMDKAEIKRMKARFLSLFEFGGKTLRDKEIGALYEKGIITDELLADSRYDIAQDHNHGYITKEMIQARNDRRLAASQKWRNSLDAKRNKLLAEDPALNAANAELTRRMEKSKDLRDSIKYVRLAVANLIGKEEPFKSSIEFGNWLEKQSEFFNAGLEKLNEKGIESKIALMADGMTGETNLREHILTLMKKLDLNKEDDVRMIEFLQSKLGERLFVIARDELKAFKPSLFNKKPKINVSVMKKALERNMDLLEEVLAIKRENVVLFESVFQFKLQRTALTEAEANDMFSFLAYDSGLRILRLLKNDPKSQYGFCFGRAYFADLILRKHGVHEDSIKKVFIYGPMKGGLFGWKFHVATIVAKEGGGFWVLDPSHGKPETLEKWLSHYRDHKNEKGEIVQGASKDDRLQMFITDGDRFGRNYWGTPDFKTNLATNYPSVWNKIFGTDYQYFRDNMKHLEKNNFDEERKTLLRALFDNILDAADLGY